MNTETKEPKFASATIKDAQFGVRDSGIVCKLNGVTYVLIGQEDNCFFIANDDRVETTATPVHLRIVEAQRVAELFKMLVLSDLPNRTACIAAIKTVRVEQDFNIRMRRA